MKRDLRLHGLSSDHHHALVLGRRLTLHATAWTDADGAALQRQFDGELEPHFRVEEEVLLPALRAAGAGDLVERTLEDHAVLRALVARARQGDFHAARAFGERITAHVRFEENELFPACEQRVPADVLDEASRRAPKGRPPACAVKPPR